MQTISGLLKQLVASPLASSTLLQDDNNWEQEVQTYLVEKLRDFTCVVGEHTSFANGSGLGEGY